MVFTNVNENFGFRGRRWTSVEVQMPRLSLYAELLAHSKLQAVRERKLVKERTGKAPAEMLLGLLGGRAV
jgi:hypothetical protein